MKKLVSAVTICGMAMSILSCSGIDSAETISFEKEPAFSVSIDRVIEDKLTMVLVVDDSASMVAKTAELETDMKDLFTDLIKAQWDIDLHLVTCAFYKGQDSDMKSVSTEDFKGKTTEEKVAAIMKKATPKIDLSTLQNDADERCNQSLEKAWSLLEPKNKINLSLIISNEDDCSRDANNLALPQIVGGSKDTCSPITYNQMINNGVSPFINKPLNEWASVVADYSDQVWVPWFNSSVKKDVHSPEKYVEFLKNLEVRGSKTIENFSHIYLPIVVDSPACLADTFHKQFKVKEAAAEIEAINNHPTQPPVDFIFDGLTDYSNILANIGHSYLKTFELMDQDIEFSQKDGDLSLCKDLSHIVGKISREIKLRGNGITIALPRPIDVETMKVSQGENFKIIRVTRPAEVEEPGFFEQRNTVLNPLGLTWVKLNDTHWAIDLGFSSGFVNYTEGGKSVELVPNRLVSTTGGDEISVLTYDPLGFKDAK